MERYWALLVFLIISAGFAFGMVLVSHLLGPKKRVKNLEPYECGVKPKGDTKIKFPQRFYLIALLFLIFDLEVVFLFPYAVKAKDFGPAGIIEVLIFIAILLFGLIYVWRRGGLEWE